MHIALADDPTEALAAGEAAIDRVIRAILAAP